MAKGNERSQAEGEANVSGRSQRVSEGVVGVGPGVGAEFKPKQKAGLAPEPASTRAPETEPMPDPAAPAHHTTALERASYPVDHPAFDQFVATIYALRAPDGCPWDREQTHASISHNMIEEAYEAVDAIESGEVAHLREELGDVLLQVVLQSQIAADAGEFTIDDVCADVNAKMVRRHPHVFGDAQAADAAEVLDLWDQVKLSEREAGASSPSLLDGVPVSFPALMQAQKISRKAAAVGFEWDSLEDVWDQVRSEIDELDEAYAIAPKAENGKVEGDPAATARVEDEFGDVLFSLVNVARRMGIDSESSLRGACRKFRSRWSFVEVEAARRGARAEDLSTAEMNELWNAAKREER